MKVLVSATLGWLAAIVVADAGAASTPRVDPDVTVVSACRLSLISFRTAQDGWLSDYCGNVFRTADGGEGWTRDLVAEKSLFEQDIAATAAPATASPEAKAFAAGAGTSLEALQRMAKRGHLEFMHWFSPTEAVTGGYIGAFVLRTTDAGKSWTRVAVASKQSVYAIATRGDVIWTCGSSGEINASSDRGRTWRALKSPIGSERCAQLSLLGDRQALAVSLYGGTRWTTADGGATWTRDPASPAPAADRTDALSLAQRARVKAASPGLSSARGNGRVRIEEHEGRHQLLVFEDADGRVLTMPPRGVGSGKTVPVLAIERLGKAAYGWTTDRLFFADDGVSWYALGELPVAPRRMTFVNRNAVVLEGSQGTFRSEDRGKHWKPSALAAIDVADADRSRPGGEAARPPRPFTCLETAANADLDVKLEVGDIGFTQSEVKLTIRKGKSVLTGGVDGPARTVKLSEKPLRPSERIELLRGLTAATIRPERPSSCWSSVTQTVDVTWSCDGRSPGGHVSFTSKECGPHAAGAAPSEGYARALGIAEWADALLKRKR